MIKNKLQKILFVLMITGMCILSLATNVNAATTPKQATLTDKSKLKKSPTAKEIEALIGQTIFVDHLNDKYKSNKSVLHVQKEADHMYCVQHSASGYDGVCIVDAYVKITGDEGVGYHLKDRSRDNAYLNNTGKYLYKGTFVEKKGKGQQNVILSYLLQKQADKYALGYIHNGTDKGEVRRGAIALYMQDHWFDEMGLNLGIGAKWKGDAFANPKSLPDYANHSKTLVQDAKDYAKEGTHVVPKIKTNTKKIESITNQTVGPFSIDYEGVIDSIYFTYTDGNGNKATSKKLEISTNKAGTNIKEFKDIVSGKEYYIQNKTSKVMESITIKLKQSEVLTSEIWFLEHVGGSSNEKEGQRLIKTYYSMEKMDASITIPIEQLGSLTINKQDESTKQKLNGAKFKIYSVKDKEWVKGTATGSKTYTDEDNATAYIAKEGTVTISNLKDGTYRIYEIKAPTGYILSQQDKYNDDKKWARCGDDITINKQEKNTKNVKVTINNKNNTTQLIINKTDQDNPDIKLRAGFKIYCEETQAWVLGKEGGYTYDNTEEQANDNLYYTSKTDGSLTLKNIKKGTYYVYEVEAPKGYDLTAQPHYYAKGQWIKVGGNTISDDKKTITFNCTNKKTNEDNISIAGYVWIDQKETKGNNYNNLFDDFESKVGGVTVNLRKSSDNTLIASVITDKNGAYKFENKVTESTLKDYYIEFNYSDSSKTIVNDKNIDLKDYTPVDVDDTNANGSRAKETQGGIAATQNGLDSFGKFYDSNTKTLNNINLGLRFEEHGDFNIEENLAEVKISINGYDYTYEYGGKGDESKMHAPKVSWQSKANIEAYTRLIYPSDVRYNSIPGNENKLKVSVTYRIDIKNNTTTDTETYKEIAMYVTKLTDTFDSERYTLADGKWEGKENTAILKDLTTINNGNDGIGKDKSAKTTFITFDVNDNAIKAMLDEVNNPKGIIEKFPTKAIATEKHKYKTKINGNLEEKVGKEETVSDEAPYLIFRLGESRTISGKVFEDKVENPESAEKLGNGKYDDKENVVGNVLVELLDSNKNLTNLYIKEESEGKPANIQTGKDGMFELKGIVPGKYYIRFTYGDGQQQLYDTSGNPVKDGEKEKTVLVKDYKSTIVKSPVEEAFKTPTDDLWFKDLDNYSIAIDDSEMRKEGTTPMAAYTPRVSIPVENIQGEDKSEYSGFNFGIITKPGQKVKVDKIVTNMKLTNAQNNVVFEGNPKTAEMKGVSDLDKKSEGGSNYVRVELAEESIYGSTLVLTYGIKVTNISDVDYSTDEYYNFGKVSDEDKNKEVKLRIDEVTDYLDSSLKYLEANGGKDIEINDENKEQIKIKGLGTLYTANGENKDKSTSKTVTLVAQRILSNQDNDMEVVNEAKVTSATLVTEEGTEIKKITDLGEGAKATVTITPPTGADKQTIVLYSIAGATMLAMLSVGIVVIKKRIL